ncbi:excisionase family DNA-binding protein [Intestinimonas butyriciproducens]|uniref:Excisionase family DNA binding protein n=1 Tax=Intestinimonas butyriciproducens TaxID=1297617 RepID=A0A2U1CCE0_9FIRM|nr:excisionase family DNA-binding protein [Intestinimonas butyriciproducens]MCR1906109.1 helix-turn-helix domain-containing protein [Intestinimonas butyriciproducens]PVY58582.1 excisionase family DNA binding protein [Intestinimonas butyriciproducens]QBB65606.1 hypothetical protein SRB521_01344 [Intestinimonas butyriciproducens]
MEKLTITVEEMANVVGVSRPKAYELIHKEGFPAVRIGRRVVIPIDGLKRWLEEQAVSVG